MFGEIWDYICDGFEALKDFISEAFSNLGELSMYGICFGILGVAFILFTNQWMLGSFLKYMNPVSQIVTTILTYLITFIACYILGNRFENSG